MNVWGQKLEPRLVGNGKPQSIAQGSRDFRIEHEVEPGIGGLEIGGRGGNYQGIRPHGRTAFGENVLQVGLFFHHLVGIEGISHGHFQIAGDNLRSPRIGGKGGNRRFETDELFVSLFDFLGIGGIVGVTQHSQRGPHDFPRVVEEGDALIDLVLVVPEVVPVLWGGFEAFAIENQTGGSPTNGEAVTVIGIVAGTFKPLEESV